MLRFLEFVEHKSGWYPFEGGHAQIAFRAKALRTPDPYYERKKFHLRTSIVKRKGVWWLIEVNHDLNRGHVSTTLEEEAEVLVSSSYLQNVHTLPRDHSWHLRLLKDSWNTSWALLMAAVPREENQLACDLFITGNPEFLERFKKVVKSHVKIGHGDVNDLMILMFTGQRVKWIVGEKTQKKSHIAVEQSLSVSELTEVVIPKGLKDEDKCDKNLHTAYSTGHP